MKYADLHVHTFYSDSTFSPEEVVACAREKGLDAIAICDHDSVDGMAECQSAGARVGVQIIPGVELSAEKMDAELHILGYFIDWEDLELQKILKAIQEWRVSRIYKMVERLAGVNVRIDPKDVFALAGKGSVGRLHLAQAMLKAGKVRRIKDAFEKYIGFLKPCYVPNMYLSPQDAIKLISDSGGVPVLAHPSTVGNDEYIKELVEYGLKGIEVYHTDHDAGAVRHYEGIARDRGLIATGGSDCHGLGKGRVLMGGVKVGYEVVETLKEESDRIKDARR